MAAADAATIASGTPGFTLMERAGRAVARAVISLARHHYGLRVAVVCGKGNNGGDGFVAARVLHHNGAGVRCLLLADASEYVGDAAAHLEILTHAGVATEPFDASRLEGCDVVVDAIFGTGFRGAAEGRPAEAIEAINDAGAGVVAVDVPSGVAGETGTVEGRAVRADVTVTLAAQKLGTALAPGSIHAGDVSVVDIGIAMEEATAFMAEPDDIRRLLPERARDAHKRSLGSVVVLAGSDGMSGAALLTARGASRTGAGYVTLVSTSYVDHAKRAILPETVSRVSADHSELGPEVLDEFAADIERAGAVALGPGMGRGKRQRALVEAVLSELPMPVVVDADALNELAEDVGPLVERSAPSVITPHPGEMGMLLGMSAAEIQVDRVAAARRAADELGSAVVLKGAGTIVTDRGRPLLVNPTGGPELATAGTGDVLTGVIAALLAERLDPADAAAAGVYVHGLAGTRAGLPTGGRGVVAWDVAEALPGAIAELLG